MLWLYILLPVMIFSGLSIDNSCPRLWSEAEEWQPITSFMESRCLNYTHAEAFLDIKNAWWSAIMCYLDITHLPGKPKNVLLCTDFAQESCPCMEYIVSKLEPHLAPEESYFPDFALSSYEASWKHLCKDGEKSMKEKIDKINRIECEDDIEKMTQKATKKCIPKLKFIQNLNGTDSVLKKSDLCSNLQDAKVCIVGDLQEQCTDNAFSSLVESIFESYLSWCQNTPGL